MDNDFQKSLLATFKLEARERLARISANLLELEQTAAAEQQQRLIEGVFRETHSLKGAARAVQMTDIETVSHALESVFSAMKRRQIHVRPELFDLFHAAVDSLDQLLLSLEAGETPADAGQYRDLVYRLERSLHTPAPPPLAEPAVRPEPSVPPPPRPAESGTVRIATEKLDVLLREAEELLSVKLAATQRADDLAEIGRLLAGWEKEWKKFTPLYRTGRRRKRTAAGEPQQAASGPRQPAGKVRDFLDAHQTQLKALKSSAQRLARTARLDRDSLGRILDSLLDDLKKLLLLPFSTLLATLPKLVRDLARDRRKEVALILEGGELEIDRRILEEMRDPFLHLVRNCIDHGIEAPAERLRQNKPATGTLTIAVTPLQGSRVEILVADDGAGIDLARLRDTALKQGLLLREELEQLADDELLPLVFTSGVSTSPLITDLSGRGLGLAIVREKVENLGGTVTLTTAAGQGASFCIVLPLSLSTQRGVLVAAGGQQFLVPAKQVEQVGRMSLRMLKTVENRETISLAGETLSFVRLAAVLELPRAASDKEIPDRFPFFVLQSGETRIAFGVDQVLNEQEMVVKNLGRQLSRVRNISGATVQGTGRVVPILNPADLVKSAVRVAAGPATAAPLSLLEGPDTGNSILIAEDSITSRALLKNILEAAGYRVKTALDGLDALMMLNSEEFDLVVSDVDMPRLNGFELTARIRGSGTWAELPVVLVTSLDSREDRERGIDVGASAYIVKSSFDQSNLLDVIRKLL